MLDVEYCVRMWQKEGDLPFVRSRTRVLVVFKERSKKSGCCNVVN